MNLKEFIFTGMYSGYFPVAPGTAGSLVAMGIYIIEYYLFGKASWIANLAVVLVMIYPSIKISGEGERFFGKKDPQEVVLDEMLGYWIAVLFYPFNWKIAVTAFFVFRFFDIIKPFPVNRIQKMQGGMGIVMDDIIAGVYANLVMLVLTVILPAFKISIF